MFDILKLIGGISSAGNAEKSGNGEPSYPFGTRKTPTDSNASPQPEKHNVMADVIERHERIVMRVKK